MSCCCFCLYSSPHLWPSNRMNSSSKKRTWAQKADSLISPTSDHHHHNHLQPQQPQPGRGIRSRIRIRRSSSHSNTPLATPISLLLASSTLASKLGTTGPRSLFFSLSLSLTGLRFVVEIPIYWCWTDFGVVLLVTDTNKAAFFEE